MTLLLRLCTALLAVASLNVIADRPSLIQSIEQQTVFRGRLGGTTWFHPRVCVIAGKNGPVALMTLQSIMGSDVYGPVHCCESSDNGLTWNTPRPIPGWGRKQ